MAESCRKEIVDLLNSTGRENMDQLISHMDENGFFTSPCSGSYHLAYEGGLAEHSLNVCRAAFKLLDTLGPDMPEGRKIPKESVIIASILHDLGKMGQFGKPNYVPNMLKGRATKANPNPEPYQSEKKPFITNPELLSVDHEIRSIQIASQFIRLEEEESYAILNHNGMYSNLRYAYSGKETPLNLIIHWADMWAARVIETREQNSRMQAAMNRGGRHANGEGYADSTAGIAIQRLLREERKIAMGKKRNCRRTTDENMIHEKAVKMLKMTDSQLVHYVEDRVEKAKSEGFNKGKEVKAETLQYTITDFAEEIGRMKGIGMVTMGKIRELADRRLEELKNADQRR